MNRSDLELRLLKRLHERGKAAVGIGIDLGTTKSSIACASFDPVSARLSCECVKFPQPDGPARVAVPSVVVKNPMFPKCGYMSWVTVTAAGPDSS